MYILGIDSSSGQVSIAVNKDQQLLSKIEYGNGKNQRYMVNIIYLIDKALKKANVSLDFVDLFAVNIGPGDFTCTRIGMTVAKTLAWIGSKPICGIESLDITALGIFFKNLKKIKKLLEEGKQIIIVPMLDVKRNEVFFSFFKAEESGLDVAAADRKNYDNRYEHPESRDEHQGFKAHTISTITIQNKNYFINKFSGGYLTESKDFTKKFNTLFVPDNGFSSYTLMGGSGFSGHEHFESAFHLNLCAYYSYLKNKQEDLEKIKDTEQSDHEIPDYSPEDYGLAPLYVREFTPFKR
ncbi:MAG: tRNA (adenosine(37)-N6)-threonylcarbamoyltransferase complex dimerization subunit type 1 TsaB [Actinobacteria bacterium]|nr:tRNA (adenosine(37)-N6)-threonylcarbamoyltransferase complex dimerization subunit type 1 TsaB [Actinomycetota bacterium]MCL5070121.1 tRNA (adenosine(37)-N6)-threonylcarbamoyltransferase complex dimerization subunit type 1 TsaB [Actinomycetota bacterium]